MDSQVGWPPHAGLIAQVFNARAKTYDESEMHRWVADRTVAALGEMRGGATVLDAAAGTALAGRRVLAQNPTCRVVAVDLAGELLAVGGQHPRIAAVRADVAHLPIADATITAIICVSAAAYFPDVNRVLREFQRVARPGGVLVLQVWQRDGLSIPRMFREAANAVGLTVPDPNGNLGEPHQLQEAMTSAGFAEVSVARDVWLAAWARPGAAWQGLVGGLTGEAVHRLHGSTQAAMRSHFIAATETARNQHDYDEQVLLIARAVVR